MNREELSKYRYKLVDSIHKHCVDQEGYVLAYKVADFIIEDRKRICSPITNLRPEHNLYTAVKETLRLAGLDKDMEGGK